MPPLLDRPVVASLWDIVQRYGAEPAVTDASQTIDFATLWRMACRVAKQLGEGGPVGVCLPPDVTYLPAVLGCLMAGRIAVLMDPSVPVARNEEIVRQTGPALLFTAEHDREIAGAVPHWTVALTEGDRNGPVVAPVPVADLFAPAFILCTSGSSGQPKAVVQHQLCPVVYSSYQVNAFATGPGAMHLCTFLPSAFTGLIGLLTFALSGGCTRLFDLRREGLSGLADMLRADPDGILRISPSVVRLVMQDPEARVLMSHLQGVMLIGEVVLQSDVTALHAVLTAGGRIFSNYGATECAGLGWFHAPDDAFDPVRGPAGRPIPGADAMLVDEAGLPVPPGEAGELVIRSRYNALGVWVDGRIVPGRLLPDPADPARRIYRTGDFARCRGDVYVVLGRVDRMVKVNGVRVEPAEIEEKARQSGETTACAVMATETAGKAVLTAYVVLSARGDVGRLRAYLRQTLPGAMVPSGTVVLERLPLLASGKVDYRALPLQVRLNS